MDKPTMSPALLGRRDFHRLIGLAALGLAAPAAHAMNSAAARVGVCSFSFRDRSRGDAIDAMKRLGTTRCELFHTHIYLPTAQKPDGWLQFSAAQKAKTREFRLTAQQSHFDAIRREFDEAGIEIYLYYSGIGLGTPDDEVEREFLFAKWLGVPAISFMTEFTDLPRFVQAADRHDLKVALHNTTSLFRRIRQVPAHPEEIIRQLELSDRVHLNLDAGHFYAAGHDPIAFMRQHHARILNVQLKNRLRPELPNLPCGPKGAPVGALVREAARAGWPMSFSIEYEHGAADLYTEVKRCLDDARS